MIKVVLECDQCHTTVSQSKLTHWRLDLVARRLILDSGWAPTLKAGKEEGLTCPSCRGKEEPH